MHEGVVVDVELGGSTKGEGVRVLNNVYFAAKVDCERTCRFQPVHHFLTAVGVVKCSWRCSESQ